VGRHRDADGHDIVRDRLSGTNLEPEPVVDVHRCCVAEFGFDDLLCHVAVDIDVDGCANAEVSPEQSSRTLDDPALVREVETLKKSVVGDLALGLL
jgi:hypothetical protein